MGMQELCADAFQEAKEVGAPQRRRVGGRAASVHCAVGESDQ